MGTQALPRHSVWVTELVEEAELELWEEEPPLEVEESVEEDPPLEVEEGEEEDPVQVAPGVAQALSPGPETRMQVEFWHSVWNPQGISSEQSLPPGVFPMTH